MFEGENLRSRPARISTVTEKPGHPHIMGLLALYRCWEQDKEKQNCRPRQVRKAPLPLSQSSGFLLVTFVQVGEAGVRSLKPSFTQLIAVWQKSFSFFFFS